MSKQHLRLYHRSTLLPLAQGPQSKLSLWPMNQHILVRPWALNQKLFQWHYFPKFSFIYGVYLAVDLLLGRSKIPNFGKFVLLPCPLRLFFWAGVMISKRRRDLLLYSFDPALPSTQTPLAPEESEIQDPERIHYLKNHLLKLIDRREDQSSLLYKDPRDERLWQILNFSEQEQRMIHVTATQWQYFYGERRFEQKFGKQQDQDLYESFEDDPLNIECSEEGCSRVKIRFSSFCRDHHFELIMGRSFEEKND